MNSQKIRFALNHRACPRLDPIALVEAAAELGMAAVELRNDVRDNSVNDIDTARAVGDRAARYGIEVLSINALYPFNVWNDERIALAEHLAAVLSASGGSGLVCCPLVDPAYSAAEAEKTSALETALRGLMPILEKYDLKGFVEPLGFPSSSLRCKQVAVDAIRAVGGEGLFGLVHDTFHHAGAGESVMFPDMTGLVHVSAVVDPGVSFQDMLDAHRVFVGPGDRLDSIGQVRQLLAGGYGGYVSFEPFADELWELEDPLPVIRQSMDYMQRHLEG
jgi:2-keto-myo-inositol isomerase